MRRKRPKSSILAAAVVGTAMAVFPALAAGKSGGSSDTTVKGEVLDLACYIAEGAKGAGHAECAKECAKGGQPMGLLGSDGTVYVLLADHGDASAFEKTKDLAGQQVEITGTKGSQGSLKGITVHAVKAL